MLLLYNLALQFYVIAIHIAAFFSNKAKLWIDGRKTVFEDLEHLGFQDTDKIIWIHTASLGEFEQGRPIIEQLKKVFPQYKILLSFFSPSGYEIRKNYALADHICYLPMDSKRHAQQFIKTVNPQLAIFIKYDLWYHYLNELQKIKTPILLISALFRKDQFYFKFFGRFFKPVLKKIDHIFVQNKSSEEVLHQHGISNTSIAGDSRIDRVIKIAAEKKRDTIVEQFIDNRPVFIFGSTWPEDEAIISPYINAHPQKYRYIIASHDISIARIKSIENQFQLTSIRYSEAANNQLRDYDLLIIDNIGKLSAIYQYGKLAYIGGAFGKGLHNILEPAAFGLPLIFGPRYQKFEEANSLIEQGAGFSIKSSTDFQHIVNQLQEDTFYNKSATIALAYIQKNQGATTKIINFIKEVFQ